MAQDPDPDSDQTLRQHLEEQVEQFGHQHHHHQHGEQERDAAAEASLELADWERAAWERQQGVWEGWLQSVNAAGEVVDRAKLRTELAIDFEENQIALRVRHLVTDNESENESEDGSQEPKKPVRVLESADPTQPTTDYIGHFEGRELVFEALGLRVRAWAVSDSIVVYHWVRPGLAETVVETVTTYSLQRRGRTMQRWILGQLDQVSTTFDERRVSDASTSVDPLGDETL